MFFLCFCLYHFVQRNVPWFKFVQHGYKTYHFSTNKSKSAEDKFCNFCFKITFPVYYITSANALVLLDFLCLEGRIGLPSQFPNYISSLPYIRLYFIAITFPVNRKKTRLARVIYILISNGNNFIANKSRGMDVEQIVNRKRGVK